MVEQTYVMGKPMVHDQEQDARIITFVVTEDCNLACKYCYITGKNDRHRMKFPIAKKAIDYILEHSELFPEERVVWSFIGGEPFLEIDLLTRITEYIHHQIQVLDHKWRYNYKFRMATNGLLYHTPKVQDFIRRNKSFLQIGLSLDGNKEKHDLQRITPDGKGSYEQVVKNLPLWLEQFPEDSVRVTFSSDDLPYLKDSILHLFELGVINIQAQIVYEDVWQEGDDKILEQQMRDLADQILSRDLWDKVNCSLFLENVGFPLEKDDLKENFCGVKRNLAVDYRGKFYPCMRFMQYSLNKREEWSIGDYEKGINTDHLRAFYSLNLKDQSKPECISCQVATGCVWCQALNYDEAEFETIYTRTNYHCKLHKARVRANDYYWARLKQVAGIEREVCRHRNKYMYFLLNGSSVRYCAYTPDEKKGLEMSLDIFQKGLEYAKENFYQPVMLLSPDGLKSTYRELLKGIEVRYVQKASSHFTETNSLLVFDNQVEEVADGLNCILLITPGKISQLSDFVLRLFSGIQRVNLIVTDIEKLTEKDLQLYRGELEKISEYMIQQILAGEYRELSVISDRLYLRNMVNCNAGVDSFTLGPDGNFYFCPAFYYHGVLKKAGNIEEGINPISQEYLTADKSPICSHCDAYHCRRCIYLNKKLTREYLIPGKIQCLLSHTERTVSKNFASRLITAGAVHGVDSITQIFPNIDYEDPFDKVNKELNGI